MKKFFSITLAAVFAAAALTGCSAKIEPAKSPASTTTPAPTQSSNIVKLGLGHITAIDKSTDLGKDKDGKDVLPTAQADTVIAAVAFDKDGRVVKITIDDAQNKVEFNKDLTIKSDLKADLKTKVELKEDYGLAKASGIKKEWYQQVAELEKWMTGKTVADIKALKTKKKDDAHPAVPDIPELTSSVTISVQEFISAVDEAYKNAVDVKGNATKVGLGHVATISSSKPLGKDKDGKDILPVAEFDVVMASAAFDKDGKVVTALIDTAQTKVEYSKDGKVTSDKTAAPKTKVELGENYGMAKQSGIKKEWYQQIAELQKWMVGKSVDDIKALKTVKKDDSHPSVPDAAELKSLVTISVQDYIASVAESYKNAK